MHDLVLRWDSEKIIQVESIFCFKRPINLSIIYVYGILNYYSFVSFRQKRMSYALKSMLQSFDFWSRKQNTLWQLISFNN